MLEYGHHLNGQYIIVCTNFENLEGASYIVNLEKLTTNSHLEYHEKMLIFNNNEIAISYKVMQHEQSLHLR